MATHELYIGGPSTKNYGLSMFPAVPFVETGKDFQVGPAAHKGPAAFNLKRRLDFSGADHALAEFVRNTAVVAADRLGAILVPKNMLFLGFSVQVIQAGPATLSLTPNMRGKAHTWAPIDCAVVMPNPVFYAGSGAAVPQVLEGVASLALAVFDNKPDMLDLVVTTLPATKFGSLILEITPVLIATSLGGTP
jgi:hypothetical protein